MKKQITVLALIAILFSAIINLSSCEKDKGKLPNIAFKTTAGYTYQDTTVAQGASLLTGIIASKSEGADVIKSFNVSRKINSGTDSTISNVSSLSADGYTQDVSIVTLSGGAHTEKWSYTVTNRDGLTNTVSLTLTVN